MTKNPHRTRDLISVIIAISTPFEYWLAIKLADDWTSWWALSGIVLVTALNLLYWRLFSRWLEGIK